eukprot:352249-Chlamydomonas_euryale.AAC.8
MAPTGQAHLDIALAALCAGGGVVGYLKKGSLPSVSRLMDQSMQRCAHFVLSTMHMLGCIMTTRHAQTQRTAAHASAEPSVARLHGSTMHACMHACATCPCMPYSLCANHSHGTATIVPVRTHAHASAQLLGGVAFSGAYALSGYYINVGDIVLHITRACKHTEEACSDATEAGEHAAKLACIPKRLVCAWLPKGGGASMQVHKPSALFSHSLAGVVYYC